MIFNFRLRKFVALNFFYLNMKIVKHIRFILSYNLVVRSGCYSSHIIICAVTDRQTLRQNDEKLLNELLSRAYKNNIIILVIFFTIRVVRIRHENRRGYCIYRVLLCIIILALLLLLSSTIFVRYELCTDTFPNQGLVKCIEEIYSTWGSPSHWLII